MSEYRMGTKCVQAGYTPGNGEPRQVPIIPFPLVKDMTPHYQSTFPINR